MSEATCKGSYYFGSACGHCSRCKEERAKAGKEWNAVADLENKLAAERERADKLQSENARHRRVVEAAKICIEDHYVEALHCLDESCCGMCDLKKALAAESEKRDVDEL